MFRHPPLRATAAAPPVGSQRDTNSFDAQISGAHSIDSSGDTSAAASAAATSKPAAATTVATTAAPFHTRHALATVVRDRAGRVVGVLEVLNKAARRPSSSPSHSHSHSHSRSPQRSPPHRSPRPSDDGRSDDAGAGGSVETQFSRADETLLLLSAIECGWALETRRAHATMRAVNERIVLLMHMFRTISTQPNTSACGAGRRGRIRDGCFVIARSLVDNFASGPYPGSDY
jgi:hypothetical protein